MVTKESETRKKSLSSRVLRPKGAEDWKTHILQCLSFTLEELHTPPCGGSDSKFCNLLPAIRETQVRSLGWEDSLEKEMATLAWKIPWIEEPGRLQSTG